MLTTSLSFGSGGSGGVFGPSMVISGSIGGVVGLVGKDLFPDVVHNPGSYVLVGMARFFSVAGKAPISTLVMVSEMTGNYRLIVPALWVSALGFLLGGRVKLHRSQVASRLQSGAHQHELNVDLLAGRTVQDLIDRDLLDTDVVTVHDTMPLDEIVRLSTRTTQHHLPMTDRDGAMVESCPPTTCARWSRTVTSAPSSSPATSPPGTWSPCARPPTSTPHCSASSRWTSASCR